MSMAATQIVFLALAACIVLYWLVYALTGPRKFDQPGILHLLRYSSFLRISALILALAPPTLMGCAVWLLTWRDTTTLAVASACFLFTCVIGGLLLLEVEGVQIALSEDGVTRLSRWAEPVTLNWIDVESVRYSALNRWFIVTGKGKRIHVSRYLVGVNEFASMVRAKVAAERSIGAVAALHALTKKV